MAELATSAGKTLISYLVAAYLKKTGEADMNNKFLMIVPRSDLIGQTADKFEKVYCNGTVSMKVARMGGKFNPHTKKAAKAIEEADVIVATYQTLANCTNEFFAKIRHVNVDEAHTTTNATIRDILKKCAYLKHRFGLSGTIEINTDSADYCRLQEYLGPCVMVVTAKDLIDSEYSPDIFIKAIKLQYDEMNDETVRNYVDLVENGREMYVNADEFGKMLYNLERQILTSHPVRLEFIVSLVRGLKMNTLILFNDVRGKYGRTIYDKLVEYGERAYYIDGGVSSNNREDYTHAIEKYNDVKLIASFGTFSTGIDIKNVYNIIFVESYKSPVLIRQSIGRGMRNLAGKYSVNIIDIVDTFGKYSSKHYKDRKTIYKDQQFPVTEHKYDLRAIYERVQNFRESARYNNDNDTN
jgi:superfamily II DNA or RNA helicase